LEFTDVLGPFKTWDDNFSDKDFKGLATRQQLLVTALNYEGYKPLNFGVILYKEAISKKNEKLIFFIFYF